MALVIGPLIALQWEIPKDPLMRNTLPVILLFCIYAYADNQIRYANELGRLSIGCRIAALGDAGVVVPDNAFSGYWNPGLSCFSDAFEFYGEYGSLYGGLSSIAPLALGAPLQDGLNLSAMYIPFFSGDIEGQDTLSGTYRDRLEDYTLRPSGGNTGYFQNNQNQLLLCVSKSLRLPMMRTGGISYPLPIDIGVGCSFKGYWSTINALDKVRMGMNINCDIGLAIRFSLDYNLAKKMIIRQLYLGVAIRDVLPTSMVWLYSPDEYSERVASARYYGISYIDRSGFIFGNWTLAISMQRDLGDFANHPDETSGYATTYHAGIEGEFWDAVALRLGISDRHPTIGAGIHFGVFSVDYAYRVEELANSVVRVSAGLKF